MPSWSAEEVAGWSGGTWKNRPTRPLCGVSSDTRSLEAGSLYVALNGPNFDGHSFVEEAFRKGAAAAMVDNRWNNERMEEAMPGKACLCVTDTRKGLGDLARGYRGNVKARMTAVTGSAGKSTVKNMIAEILSTTFRTAASRGNWNNDIGLPLSILAMERDTEAGVFEVGTNHPGELGGLCGMLRPDWGVVTNVGPVHIEFFGSVEAIAREKAVVLQSLPREGTAVINQDTQCFDVLRSMAAGKIVTVSLSHPADYRCLCMDARRGAAEIEERATGERFECTLKLPGEHNVMNALLAVAVTRGQGVSWDGVRAGLERFSPLPMRWEELKIAGATVINDAYNANPMSMRTALRTLESVAAESGRWLVLGGMLELGAIEKEEHRALGRLVGCGNWKGLVTVGRLGEEIANGAEETLGAGDRIFRCHTTTEAAQLLADRVRPGDFAFLKASRGIHLEEVIQAWKEIVR